MNFGPEGTAGTLQWWTRFLVNDPSTAASQLFSTDEVKNAINDSYGTLLDEARLAETGVGRKRTYATSVADQVFYSLPNDFMKMSSVEISTTGADLSGSAEPTWLRPIDAATGLEMLERGIETQEQHYFIHGNNFGIVKPPTAGGANALRLSYEGHGTALSADGDEPLLRDPYQRLICYDAAIILKAGMDMDIPPTLQQRRDRVYIRFLEYVAENIEDHDGQIPVSGVIDWQRAGKSGYIERTERIRDRSVWPQ